MQIHSLLIFFDRIHVFYPVRQQASQQGSQRNKNVFQQNKKTITTLRNLFANRIKLFYSVEDFVQKPVGEQDKTDEFSHSVNEAPFICSIQRTIYYQFWY